MKAEQQRLPRFAVLIDADNTSPQIAERPFRGSGEIRRGQRSPHLRGFFRPAAQIMVRDPAKARHRSLSAVCLHQRQERVRHCAGHRRDGSVAQRAVRRLLPRCLPTAISRALPRGCANRAPTSTVSVHRKRRRVSGRRAADSSTPRIWCRKLRTSGADTRIQTEIFAAAECRNSDSEKGYFTNRERGRVGDARARSASISANLFSDFDVRYLRP